VSTSLSTRAVRCTVVTKQPETSRVKNSKMLSTHSLEQVLPNNRDTSMKLIWGEITRMTHWSLLCRPRRRLFTRACHSSLNGLHFDDESASYTVISTCISIYISISRYQNDIQLFSDQAQWLLYSALVKGERLWHMFLTEKPTKR